MREDVVEDHQPLERPAERHTLAEPNVSLFDGVVEGRVVKVVDASLAVSAEVGRRQLSARQLLEEVDHLLPADDSGKRAVPAAQKETGMQHHFDQEGGLPVSEAECCDPLDALLVVTGTPRRCAGWGCVRTARRGLRDRC